MLYELTDEEIIKADEYEVDDYKRIEAVFKSGKTGFIYVKK
jgi:predicted SnoaL-like aldol condensation-catalyzing enzyme